MLHNDLMNQRRNASDEKRPIFSHCPLQGKFPLDYMAVGNSLVNVTKNDAQILGNRPCHLIEHKK